MTSAQDKRSTPALGNRLSPWLRWVGQAIAACLMTGLATAQVLPTLIIGDARFSGDASVVEGNFGSKLLSLPVSFAGAQPNAVTGKVSAIPLDRNPFNPATGRAQCDIEGTDFVQFEGTAFTIAPNTPNRSFTVNIRICGDIFIERDQHIFVFFHEVVGAECLEGTCSAVVTIIDNDAPPTLSINNIATSEPAFGTRNAFFTVSLNRVLDFPVTVNFTTRNGTARARCLFASCFPNIVPVGDYDFRAGILSIPPGVLSGSIAVPILSDSSIETTEDFFVDLSLPPSVNATIHTRTGRATIRNTALILGGFDVSPDSAELRPGEKLIYSLDWTVPPNQVWRNLKTIDIRLRGGHGTALWVRWDEASNLFSLCHSEGNAGHDEDDGSAHAHVGQSRAVCGAGELPGSAVVLATPFALLHLADTAVIGSGPTGPLVSLKLGLSLIGKSAGHNYRVELAAADDFGNVDRFTQASDLRVGKPIKP